MTDDRLQSLEQKVASLADTVAELVATPAPDQIAPNYLTTDAAGNVGADFSGDIHATGGEFRGHVFASDLHVPNETAQPRIDLDAAGLRFILGDGTEGARMAAGTPRPFLLTGIPNVAGSPAIGLGTIGDVGGGDNSKTIQSGGDEIFTQWVTVPPGMSLLGLVGLTVFYRGDVQIGLQGEESGAARLGPAATLALTENLHYSDQLIAPFVVDNSASGAARDVLLGVRVASTNPAQAVYLGGTGFMQGIFG